MGCAHRTRVTSERPAQPPTSHGAPPWSRGVSHNNEWGKPANCPDRHSFHAPFAVVFRQRVAMRQGGPLYFILTDHLGSTALLTNSSGQKVAGSAVWYFPYGETRPGSGNPPTARRFTGQLEESTIGLYDYGARFYDPALGRFLSADTVVPGAANPQALNRYAYVLNNPLKYTDPTGHKYDPDEGTTWQDTLRIHIILAQGGDLKEKFWEPYLKAMESRLLNQIGDYNGDGHVGHGDWLTWATGEGHDDGGKTTGKTYIQHVHYKAYSANNLSVEGGRVDLANYVLNLSAGTAGPIYPIGHSAGGGAILAFVLNPGAAAYTGHEVRAASLDGATDWVDKSNAAANYQYATQHGITALTVSNQADTPWPGCAHGPIDGIPHYAYNYTGSCFVLDKGCIHPLVVTEPNSPVDANGWTPFAWTMWRLGL